ncbi:flagellar hook capping FlgD N-terminal domain-containing protein [Clostridium boliviensis]|uniref:Flagellar hook capping FlgD N-terminal domain-containing protein n=1 Tax=Clostridium boliviensis TaxID=318465 RepID=A0ABU4GKK7_9CLOT|nr:flagellar hook capping FlgD N-terminal domain-containing protein [Clostridium boliviensis]MDW2798144.1 flagellar hook capping FlgD N-terminal domain-containing protein [Clostridium boliviensis]
MASTDAIGGAGNLLYNSAATGTDSNVETKKNSEVSIEGFFKLLAAQLENQDMSNPMDNSEMMTQMTQIAMMQAMDNFSTSMDDFAQVNTINYGTSMMGKTVLIGSLDKNGNMEKHNGTVTRVDIFNGIPTLYLDDDTTTGYPVSGVMSVYEKGHAPADDKPGDGDTTTGTEDKPAGGDSTTGTEDKPAGGDSTTGTED